ncbi:hypothetical protein F5B19DRAFT_368092 [Rostrohypoxylon terebratum]|nr:hypothetical protein F5B19DRAFT_368092 [Rostrohypoxylon terebratum]
MSLSLLVSVTIITRIVVLAVEKKISFTSWQAQYLRVVFIYPQSPSKSVPLEIVKYLNIHCIWSIWSDRRRYNCYQSPILQLYSRKIVRRRSVGITSPVALERNWSVPNKMGGQKFFISCCHCSRWRRITVQLRFCGVSISSFSPRANCLLKLRC